MNKGRLDHMAGELTTLSSAPFQELPIKVSQRIWNNQNIGLHPLAVCINQAD